MPQCDDVFPAVIHAYCALLLSSLCCGRSSPSVETSSVLRWWFVMVLPLTYSFVNEWFHVYVNKIN